ncbi:MAG: hypothetical protein ACE5NC_03100 [Anaerolineae bacterium]
MTGRRFLLLSLFLAFLGWSARSSAVPPWAELPYRINLHAGPHLFNWAGYELRTLSGKLSGLLRREADPESVHRYFQVTSDIRELEERIRQRRAESSLSGVVELEVQLEDLRAERMTLEERAETTLQSHVADALFDLGIAGPVSLPGRRVFPPVLFELQQPPDLLVVSPRGRIDSLFRTSLDPGLSLTTLESLEDRVDDMDVSSLVVPTGGMAAYPTVIPESSSLDHVLGAVIHEWVHNLLFFYPLGQHYFDSQEMITLNETLATMVEQEVSLEVAARRYPDLHRRLLEARRQASTEISPSPSDTSEEEFRFDAFMRETRLTVDRLLEEGKIEEAEAYMEARRVELLEHGVFIRKLNQAYFAFHGSYATGPEATSPIGGQLSTLRDRSATLAEFLFAVAQMDDPQDLLDALSAAPV